MIVDVVRLRSRAMARAGVIIHVARRGVATLAGGLVVIICALVLGGTASAQQRPTLVQAGSSTVIATSTEAINVPTQLPTGQGRAAVLSTPGTPATNVLVYFAPQPPLGSDPLPVMVDYTVGGVSARANINVTAQAPSAPQSAWGDVYGPAFKVLFILFVLATIIESGLAIIFNWRVFIEVFDSRGVKALVSVGVSALFVAALDLDVTTSLFNIYQSTNFPPSLPGKALTALVLAGGSSGVNNLLVALGFRSVRQPDQVVPKPPKEQAWVSVRLQRVNAKGSVTVLIGEPNATNDLPVAGTIVGESSRRWMLSYFMRDRGRFPTAGGYAVHLPLAPPPAGAPAGQGPVPVPTLVKIRLEGENAAGQKVTSPEWGPYKLAPGAIVDIDLKL